MNYYNEIAEGYDELHEEEQLAKLETIKDMLEKEDIEISSDCKLLDVGCGTGRHSIELSKRGYSITGIDLSEDMLRRAKQKAAENGQSIEFLQHDARDLPFENEFDGAIMLCEGGFPLMETDEMNFEILKNVTNALKIHGKIIFTTLNGLFPLFNSIEKFTESVHEEGDATYRNNNFDLMTFRDHNITELEDDNGNKKTLESNERYYVPSEITWLLKSLHYKKIDIYGAKLGAFSRNDKLTTEDFEMLVIAEK